MAKKIIACLTCQAAQVVWPWSLMTESVFRMKHSLDSCKIEEREQP